jgi:tetratricopeptide (TPR) repeat protein
MRTLTVITIVLASAAPRATAQIPDKDHLNVAHPLPPLTPPWLEGFRVRWPIRIVGEPAIQTARTVLVRIPTGGWLKPDASDLAVQSADGKLLPLAVLSHDPAGSTILQFKRSGNEPWYWVYGIGDKAKLGPRTDARSDPTFREGLTLEVRAWAGDKLDSWAAVRAGLDKSSTILGNAVVTEVVQQCNPAQPSQPNGFAVSYRGYFNVKKPGAYRFFLNADGAAFLFIDGFKAQERPGANAALYQLKQKDVAKLSAAVDFKPGVHAFEVHQAVGSQANVNGICALLWSTPEQPKFSYLLSSALAHPLYARVAGLEEKAGEAAGLFVYGLDDTLGVPGLKLLLVRFEAQGPAKEDNSFVWDFGDGTRGKGRSLTHVYFKEGDYLVSLNAGGGLPAFRQRIHVWAEPTETSPLSLDLAVQLLDKMEWQKLPPPRIRELFTFLTLCEQPDRWPLLDSVARHLLEQKDLDLEQRAQLYVARIEALTHLGRAAEALKLAKTVRPEFVKTPALQVRLRLAEAAVQQYHYRDAAAASRIYKAILDEHSRVEHPNVRLAAIRWGDLFAESGDLVKADETYRLAATLGGDKLSGATTTEASTRGALLRIAEQKLKAGDVHATRQLLERVELEFPGRRLDGLYCFLRAESDRYAGRYEEALRYYEMIFKLPQWAGYRDRATFGIADTYRRQGDLKRALKWLGDLKESFPKCYEGQKGAELEKLIRQRQKRLAAGDKVGRFKEFVTGFEPTEPAWFGDWHESPSVRALGIRGPHAILLDPYPQPMVNYTYVRPVKDLMPGGTYWVEVWVRDVVWPWPPQNQPVQIQFHLTADAPPKPAVANNVLWYRNAPHQWHKLGAKLKVPLDQDFTLQLTFLNLTGAVLVDGLRLRPVSDRQEDALLSFHEGPKTP